MRLYEMMNKKQLKFIADKVARDEAEKKLKDKSKRKKTNESRFKQFLKETSVQDALSIDEPEVGKKYDDEAVADRKSRLLDAIKQLRGQTADDEAKEAMMADLNDKLEKWENVGDETAAPDPPPAKDDGSMEKDDPGTHDDPEPSEQPREPEKDREADEKQADKDRDEEDTAQGKEEDQKDDEKARANDKQAQKQNLAAKKKKPKNEGRLIKSRIFKL